MSPKTSVLEPLRVRIRRFQFIVGLGFIALVAGSALSVSLTLRLSLRVQALPFMPLKILAAVLLENLWLLGVLPLLCYGAGRVMELKPWHTAGGAAVSGSVFVIALGFVQGGVDSLWMGGLGSVLNVAAFGVGIVVSAKALMMGRAAAAQQSVQTQAKAEERKSEYDEFLRAAEQGGARLEQREAQGAATAGAPVADASSSVVEAPAPVADVLSPAPSTPASVADASSVAETPAPVVDASSVAETPAPVVDASSVAETPAPVVDASSPVVARESAPGPTEERAGQVIHLPEQAASPSPVEAADASKTPAA
ncbi:hypothetical protein MYSTI_05603 [Myxococcus stipitatus DSM 14675]|uniref:Uncharacterized protein n=1 Tax=Myxococcus stipitatus (strain DSM 14675 / JCM 12634 / Mx s8) TaxID=1278073 RepID=L7UG54_MYXSD|nr:hypothetical protein [Myxococcus stipitatus]AGC46880.1 hypothetical protein MYSTI_05603 [Myxococcus stipitatus DSM 14675]